MIIKRIPKIDTNFQKINFGEIIKTAREECGLKQKELANQICKETATSISLMESNDRGVSAKDFYRIMEVTQYPLGDLLTNKKG